MLMIFYLPLMFWVASLMLSLSAPPPELKVGLFVLFFTFLLRNKVESTSFRSLGAALTKLASFKKWKETYAAMRIKHTCADVQMTLSLLKNHLTPL